ncbi:MAG: hypothetical protein L6R28_18490 [Planctomycetes bacterium]|nr:hypothetical protein [Planctomycetota bacterium]
MPGHLPIDQKWKKTMHVPNPVHELEQRFLPSLREAQRKLQACYPVYEFNVWSQPIGQQTQYQGHDMGLEAVFPKASKEHANNVALIIGVMHLTTEPKLHEASVGWGQGHAPDVCLELIETPVALTQGALEEVERGLPRLIETFERAIAAYNEREASRSPT